MRITTQGGSHMQSSTVLSRKHSRIWMALSVLFLMMAGLCACYAKLQNKQHLSWNDPLGQIVISTLIAGVSCMLGVCFSAIFKKKSAAQECQLFADT